MNRPDEETLRAWMQGELEGDTLRQVEAWCEENAELLEQEMGWEKLSSDLVKELPKEVEPPYADFFNERVKQHAFEQEVQEQPPKRVSPWQKLNWLFAPVAIAGMAMCFYLGTMVQPPAESASKGAAADMIYLPVEGVRSEVLQSGHSTVIVLEGLEEIPDGLDIASGETSQGVSPLLLAKMERTHGVF